MQKEESNKEITRGHGNITTKRGSQKLYVDFYYLGHRLEKTTKLNDTKDNRQVARTWLDRMLDKINKRTFRFSEAFPNASDKEKAKFAKLEGLEFSPEPHNVQFGEYVIRWKKEILAYADSETKRSDFESVINYWLLPYFGEFPFSKITSTALKTFITQHLRFKSGKRTGERLSKSRIRNILIPLREIWSDACSDHSWILPDPFTAAKKKSNLPAKPPEEFQVYRFDEWGTLLESLSPHYRLISEVFVLTGLSASELAGIKRTAIADDHMAIRFKVSRRSQGNNLKTAYRHREIPLTKRLRQLLEEVLSNHNGEHVFIMEDGKIFNGDTFRKIWMKASKTSGVQYRKPYTTRHTFAAWCLALRMDPNRLVDLMGHGTKKMIYEDYGKYVKGLEKDHDAILNYFGEDFI